jgi:pyruvate dehydrogenase E1 component
MNDQFEKPTEEPAAHLDEEELRDWLDSLEDVLKSGGPKKVQRLVHELQMHVLYKGIRLPFTANTPYVNSIHVGKQVPYPGNRDLERRIRSIIRWNAMAMVVRANRAESGIGGHISTYASAATIWEVCLNHFWRGKDDPGGGDIVFFQGHASPGIYARAFLEGRLTEQQLENFRRELRPEGGLASYPHPWLMPDFWEFPTVSMGLGPLMAIYQARFNRYLQDRGIKNTEDQKVYALLGDGECDEPEALGAISLAARERLNNLIFIVNCNLQRLDGPVRGNGKIIQELEAVFRGAGWNVIKIIWGGDWDPLFEKDKDGALLKRVQEIPDGQWQKYSVSDGAYIREDFCKGDERLKALVAHLSDEQIRRLNRGGHDMVKVYNAVRAALENRAAPTVILAKTIKGYGLGESGEGKNITHQQKKLNEDELREFRTRFSIPISDEEVSKAPFYRPPDDSPEIKYLHERRKALGGYIPQRRVVCPPLKAPGGELFDEFTKGTEGREVSTTMVYVRILGKLLRDKELGRYVVPIVPDEARTFGMEALFRQVGIYSHVGQTYEPVDRDQLVFYKEAKDGQILEEGITEAGSMSSFIAAGTAYATHGIPMIPFFTFYSMFGFQRIGDLIWAAGDMRTKGFLVGATSGRTTLNGEGLQHQDGQSHLLAYPLPNLVTYDPAFAYELAVIVREGIRRMYEAREDVFYYVTVTNENYDQPAMPAGVEEGILKGMYRFRAADAGGSKPLRAQLLGSGSILNEAVKAQKALAERYGVAADVWSVTSYKELRRDALEAERWNRLHSGEPPRVPYVTRCLQDAPGPVVATSDYVKALPDSISRWIPQGLVSLGTDGFGRSETREKLREFFEIDHRFVVLSVLTELAREGQVAADVPRRAVRELGIDPDKADPTVS